MFKNKYVLLAMAGLVMGGYLYASDGAFDAEDQGYLETFKMLNLQEEAFDGTPVIAHCVIERPLKSILKGKKSEEVLTVGGSGLKKKAIRWSKDVHARAYEKDGEPNEQVDGGLLELGYDSRPGLWIDDKLLRAYTNGGRLHVPLKDEKEIALKNSRRLAQRLAQKKIEKAGLDRLKDQFKSAFEHARLYLKERDVKMEELLECLSAKNKYLNCYKDVYEKVNPQEVDFYEKNQPCYLEIPALVSDEMLQTVSILPDFKDALAQQEEAYRLLLREAGEGNISHKRFLEMRVDESVLKENIKKLKHAISIMESGCQAIKAEQEMRVLELNGELV